MRLLDPLVRRQPQRYGLPDYAGQLAELGAFSFNGTQFPLSGVQFTQQGSKTEPIPTHFQGLVRGAMQNNGIIFALSLVRMQIFSQARFSFRRIRNGRPGDLFGTRELEPLNHPEPGLTTADLLARMSAQADFAGNSYHVRDGAEIIKLRPDWVDIFLEPRSDLSGRPIGYRRAGYIYWPNGDRQGKNFSVFGADEVAHFAPYPDPLADYRGMSWVTPVIREIMSDGAATRHKQSFFENAATPNMAVTLASDVSPQAFEEFVDKMDAQHKGIKDAYKTLYLGGGADVTVVGADMQQIDFKVTQGAGETRMAAASGIGAVIAQFSEGMQGSSLNAGNYQASRRRVADITMRHLWQNACGSMATLVNVPSDAELWYDDRDIPFLQEDRMDAAEIEAKKAATIRQLTDAGFTPDSVVAAVQAEDMSMLEHTGTFSVQLQPPMTSQQSADQPDPEQTPPGGA